MVGTPAYMSPEQIQGQQIDGRTDIFSAGVVLYQFLTGQRPFTGAGAWTIAKKIIQEDPPMPSTINVALPKEFDLVVSKALAKLPENRYADAREFARALKHVLEGKPAQVQDGLLAREPVALAGIDVVLDGPAGGADRLDERDGLGRRHDPVRIALEHQGRDPNRARVRHG